MAYLDGVANLNKPITVADVSVLNFNFKIRSGENLNGKQILFKVIGRHACFIDRHKNVTIWKLK